MNLGMSNRKFMSILFLVATIFISLALSNFAILISDSKASMPMIKAENFEQLASSDFNASDGNASVDPIPAPTAMANSSKTGGCATRASSSSVNVDEVVGANAPGSSGSWWSAIGAGSDIKTTTSEAAKIGAPSSTPTTAPVQTSVFSLSGLFGGNDVQENFSLINGY